MPSPAMLEGRDFEFLFNVESEDHFSPDVNVHKLNEHTFNNADLPLQTSLPESALVDLFHSSENRSEWTPPQVHQTSWPRSIDENNAALAESRFLMDPSPLGQHPTQLQTPLLGHIRLSSSQTPVACEHHDSLDATMGQNFCNNRPGFEPCQPDFSSLCVTDSGNPALWEIGGYLSEDIVTDGNSEHLQHQSEGGETNQAAHFKSTDMEAWLDKHLVTFGAQQLTDPVRTTAVTTAIICASKPPEVLEASEQPLENSALASAPSHVQIPKKQTDQQEPKTQRSRIPPESRSILEEHFNNDPYPTGRDIDIIAQLSNLEKKRVKNWFNNTRSRRSVQGRSRCTTCFVNLMC